MEVIKRNVCSPTSICRAPVLPHLRLIVKSSRSERQQPASQQAYAPVLLSGMPACFHLFHGNLMTNKASLGYSMAKGDNFDLLAPLLLFRVEFIWPLVVCATVPGNGKRNRKALPPQSKPLQWGAVIPPPSLPPSVVVPVLNVRWHANSPGQGRPAFMLMLLNLDLPVPGP